MNDIQKTLNEIIFLLEREAFISKRDLYNHLIANIFLYLVKNKKIKSCPKEANLIEIAQQLLEKIDNSILRAIEKILNSFDFKNLHKLFELASVRNNSRENFFLNPSLLDLVFKLLNLEKGDKILNLWSGTGDFLLNLVHKSIKDKLKFDSLVGVESNVNNYYFLQMAMSCVSQDSKINWDIKNQNPLNELNSTYNKAFCFPPIKLKIANSNEPIYSKLISGYEFPKNINSEWCYIDNLLSKMTGNQRAVVFVYPSLLYAASDRQYRKLLIGNKLLEGIIELPNNLLLNTGININLLVFSKKNEKIKYVDAKNLYEPSIRSSKWTELKVNEIMKLYNDKPVQADSVNLLNNNDWDISRVIFKEQSLNQGDELGSLSTIFTGIQKTAKDFESLDNLDKATYELLKPTDITNDLIDWEHLTPIGDLDPKLEKYVLHYGDVVLTSKSSATRIAVIDHEPKIKLLATGGMLVIRSDQKLLNPFFLKAFLTSEKGRKSLELLYKGSIIVSINAKDLSSIKLPKIDIEKQNKLTAIYKEKIINLIKNKLDLANEENNVQDFLNNLISQNLE
ncbi:N-6 DNA methylase [[Mycoplasma] testudinis]|uniref:N-6 DNA methylase n=1 Tax=[Mycoplasma] testudinis TaxID=33924 RepID=UPI00047FA24B|nr:N-6 DNA methylase [[Mycoplasma] testudinis]